MNIIVMTVGGFILDLLLGDPYSWPHPVKLMGKVISWFDRKIESVKRSPRSKFELGLLMWFIVVFGSGAVTGILMYLFSFNQWLYLLFGTYLAYTTLSIKGLATEAKKIIVSLSHDDLSKARYQLSMIVGRETKNLNADEISKATIETIAENTNDGVIAPMFYLIIGGPVLAIMYKAINTLDSMVGYKNSRFGKIGEASAVLDDVFGFIPARITWLLMVVACWSLRLDARHAVKIGRRDHNNHRSPNSAYPESVIAGALDLQLGGSHKYFGKIVTKPFIGDQTNKVASVLDIKKTIDVLYVTATISLLVFCLIRGSILFLIR